MSTNNQPLQSSSILSSSVAGAAQLLLLQVWSRLSTFILNQLALRFITREVLGFVALEMELLSSTILFLSREFIRMAVLRSERTEFDQVGGKSSKLNKKQYKEHQKIVNFGYIPILFGAIISLSFVLYVKYFQKVSKAHYSTVVSMFCLAAFVELCTEPLYIVAVNNMLYNIRVRVEGAAVFVKCVGVLAFLVMSPRDGGGRVSEEKAVMAFAWSQLLYSSTLLFGYIVFFNARYNGKQPIAAEVHPAKRGLRLLVPSRYEEDSGR
jgi:oligosaccharide translocation protein RFT1